MDGKRERMGLLNLIWILIFLYFGFRLTFQGFAKINFGAWDNIFGILLILTAIFGIYCLVRDTAVGVALLRSKLGVLIRRMSGDGGKVQKTPKQVKQPKPVKQSKPPKQSAVKKKPAVASVGFEQRDMRYRPVEPSPNNGYVSETDIHSIDLESILASDGEPLDADISSADSSLITK